MLDVSLLVLGLATLVVAELKNIGSCKVNLKTQPDFDFEKFTMENSGKWNFVKIPNTAALSDISNLQLTIQPQNEEGLYKSRITSELGQGSKREISEETVKSDGNGVVKATTKDGIEFKVYFLKYLPSKFAYYYICGKNGDDNDFDYRFVLSHEPLSDDNSAEIYKLENEFNFKGDLRDIPIVHH